MKLTDAAVGGMDRNAVRAVIALSTLFTVYTSCVMLERNKRNLGGESGGQALFIQRNNSVVHKCKVKVIKNKKH